MFLDTTRVGIRRLSSKQERPECASNIKSRHAKEQSKEGAQRRLATSTATIVIDTSSILSTPPSSQSFSQNSMSQLQMRFRPASYAKGKLTTSSDSLDTEYSPDEDEQLASKSIPRLEPMESSKYDPSKDATLVKGILRNGTTRRRSTRPLRHVRFDGACILASRCIKVASDDQPKISFSADAEDDTDQDEADDEDYEQSPTDEEDEEDSDSTDDESEEFNEPEGASDAAKEVVSKGLKCLEEEEEEEREDTDGETDGETDLETIAQINMLRNQKILMESPQTSISLTENTLDTDGFGKAVSLMSNSGFPPSSPEPANAVLAADASFSEAQPELLATQTFAMGRNGVKRVIARTNMHLFVPQESPYKKRCLGVTRRLVPKTAATTGASCERLTTKLESRPAQSPVL